MAVPAAIRCAALTARTDPFRWQDGERLIVFGRGTVAEAPGLLGEPYTLLTGGRGFDAGLSGGAAAVAAVRAGRVDEIAAELLPSVSTKLLAAVGGGRVIDAAKALAASGPAGSRVVAIPTTLSGAEMTAVHRQVAGAPPSTPRVRPAVVINDPELSASQPVAELAASAGNALGHAVEGPITRLTNPVAALAALECARLIASAFAAAEPDREALALGALLGGYVIGSTGYGLHHVMSQTLVRFAGIGHGQANTVMLQHTTGALERRSRAWVARISEALGAPAAEFASRLAAIAGVTRLADAGVTADVLPTCVEQAAPRPELHLTPPVADRDELAAIYAAAI
jgi:alcohol dehydrogenase class IV